MSQLRFEHRVAVITGAGRGLGRAYALLLASLGAKVVVNDPGGSLQGDGVDAGPAQQVVEEIKAQGGEAVANTDSVANPDGARSIIDSALQTYGQVDILIHNAGIVRPASIQEMTIEDLDSVLDVHLRGAFFVVQAALPSMSDAGYGRIVLTSSIGGLYGNHRQANYAMAKAGMIGLCNVAALEGEADGIKCNIIVPGAVTRMAEGIDTSQFPPMTPEMVAPVVAWLCHDSCSITGEMLVAIAGRVAKAFVGETPGVYNKTWSIETVGEQMKSIGDSSEPLILPVVPHGHNDHIGYSFQMAATASGD